MHEALRKFVKRAKAFFQNFSTKLKDLRRRYT